MDAKTLCLAVLSRGDASGYEIKKTLEQAPFNHFQDTGFGSIDPALGALASQGWVKGTAMAQEKRPDKKVYAITPSGRTALIDALKVTPGPDRFRSDFLFVLFLAEHLPSAHLRRLIDDRIAFYNERITAMESKDCAVNGAPAGQQLVHGFGLAIYRTARDYLVQHREEFLGQSSGPERLVAE